MLKADRDRIMGNLKGDDRKQFREFIDDYRTERKAASGGQMPAREMLDAVGAGLTDILRQAMEAVVARDEMGPHVGEVPPDFNLKRMGSPMGFDERVRLSSFKGQRPVALIFGSYT
ncbi:MAG: hypothetical protein J4N75_13085 [Chloroflexi bacterium]|nr:hypothetical protein [Chloroflexota bacterium]MCH9017429.1 hypothetical protein [Chloroflexota bacterium]MCI0788048.1 hypothetical protein [Chloroflexota bacterium]MCI0802439.1 hypothetical protein [Chloroflexota bacterium]MCI0811727.1 hypothetical protein [Chloroflexota bacterium]